jgi:hypothetical protein
MLIDTYIITPKKEWRDQAASTTKYDAVCMEALLPEKYRPLFARLIQDSLNELMDNRDHVKAYEIMARAMVTGVEGPWYAKSGESLQQAIRKTFYDTLLIIRNDYNPFKYDYFIVVHSEEAYAEAEWEAKRDLNDRPHNGRVLHFLKSA